MSSDTLRTLGYSWSQIEYHHLALIRGQRTTIYLRFSLFGGKLGIYLMVILGRVADAAERA